MKSYVDAAVNQFKELLYGQLQQLEEMQKADKKKDFTAAKKIVIGVCEGDGIGPIITKQAKRVLAELLKDEISSGKIELRDIEGLTIENRLKLNAPVPEDTLKAIKECDVLLKGPTTTPKGGSLESANVTLRRELDLYANVRPISIPEEGIEWIFYRENTEGEYIFGSKGVEIADKLAVDFKITTDIRTRRIARAAFDYAKNNGKNNVAIVTKANIMKKTDGKFTAVCHEVAKDYPDIAADDWYIDIMAANLINPDIRKKFQVFVLPNLYGDIITDEAAQIQGGVGTAGSANIGDQYAMFEAIHGSAPRMIEEGIGDFANPMSIFKAAEMLLRHIMLIDKADLLSKTLSICSEKEKSVVITGNTDGATCKEFTDYVINTIEKIS